MEDNHNHRSSCGNTSPVTSSSGPCPGFLLHTLPSTPHQLWLKLRADQMSPPPSMIKPWFPVGLEIQKALGRQEANLTCSHRWTSSQTEGDVPSPSPIPNRSLRHFPMRIHSFGTTQVLITWEERRFRESMEQPASTSNIPPVSCNLRPCALGKSQEG